MNSELIFRPEVSTALTVVIVGGIRVQTRVRTAGETRVRTVGGSSVHTVGGSSVHTVGGSSVHIVGGSRLRIVGETRVQTRARTAGETRVHTVGGSSAHIVRGSRVRIIGGSSVHIVGGSRVRIVGESRVRIVGGSRVRMIRPFVIHTITWSTRTNLPPAKNDDGPKAANPAHQHEKARETLQFKSRTNPSGHSQRKKDAKRLTNPFGIGKSVEAFRRSHFRNLKTILIWSTSSKFHPAKNTDGWECGNKSRHAENACERLQSKTFTKQRGKEQRKKDVKHPACPFGIRKSIKAVAPSHFRNLKTIPIWSTSSKFHPVKNDDGWEYGKNSRHAENACEKLQSKTFTKQRGKE